MSTVVALGAALSVSCSTSQRAYDSLGRELGDGSAVSVSTARKVRHRVFQLENVTPDSCSVFGSLSDLEFDLTNMINYLSNPRKSNE